MPHEPWSRELEVRKVLEVLCGGRDVARDAGNILVDVEHHRIVTLHDEALGRVMDCALPVDGTVEERSRVRPADAVDGGRDGDAATELVGEREEGDERARVDRIDRDLPNSGVGGHARSEATGAAAKARGASKAAEAVAMEEAEAAAEAAGAALPAKK